MKNIHLLSFWLPQGTNFVTASNYELWHCSQTFSTLQRCAAIAEEVMNKSAQHEGQAVDRDSLRDKLRDPRHTAPVAGFQLPSQLQTTAYWVGHLGRNAVPQWTSQVQNFVKCCTRGCGLQSSGHRGSRWMKWSEPPELALIVHLASEKLHSHYPLSLM